MRSKRGNVHAVGHGYDSRAVGGNGRIKGGARTYAGGSRGFPREKRRAPSYQ